MAANNIPEKLKAADISRFITRAAQLDKVKPVISYWCNYWVVNQILSKGLHNADGDCLEYTSELMDKLEKFKTENSENDAVTDDLAGHAYVENFGLETFQRAENALVANKATLQTADTFQAAATFLELCQIWGLLDSGLAAKIKFAKYHALRIAKAVKAGEDPNESNLSMGEQEREKDGSAVEQNGPAIAVTEPTDQEAADKMRQATVEDAVDDTDSMQRNLAQQSTLDESLHPSRMASPVPARPGVPKTASATSAASAVSSGMPSPNIFPAGMLDMGNRMRQGPSALASGLTQELPAAPSDFASPASSAAGTPSLGAPPEAFPPVSTFQSFPPPDPAALPPQATLEPVGSPLESPTPPDNHARPLPPQDYSRTTHLPPTSVKPFSAPRSAPRSIPQTTSSIPQAPEVNEDSIAQAQKHARWAVSALTFDDVNTAIKELRNALESLGAQ